MLIAQISDSHIALPQPDGSDRAGDLQNCVAYVNALSPQPDLVVHTGDIVHFGTHEEYERAAGILNGLSAPLLVIPGNRDKRGPFRQVFADLLPDTCHDDTCHDDFVQYSIGYGAFSAIVLDTVSLTSSKGTMCRERLSHAAEMFRRSAGNPVILFMHHPPFTVTQAALPYQFQFEDQAVLDELSDLLRRHGGVQRIFCGHSHRTAFGHFAGVPACTIPSIAADLRQGEPGAAEKLFPVHHVSAHQPAARGWQQSDPPAIRR